MQLGPLTGQSASAPESVLSRAKSSGPDHCGLSGEQLQAALCKASCVAVVSYQFGTPAARYPTGDCEAIARKLGAGTVHRQVQRSIGAPARDLGEYRLARGARPTGQSCATTPRAAEADKEVMATRGHARAATRGVDGKRDTAGTGDEGPCPGVVAVRRKAGHARQFGQPALPGGRQVRRCATGGGDLS